MRPQIKNLYFLLLLASLSGCATIFSSRHQSVYFQPTTPDANISVYGKGDITKTKKARLDKTKVYYTARVKKEGFKTSNYAFQINKRTSLFAAGVVGDIIIPFYGWFYGLPYDLMNPKTFKYDKYQYIPALIPYEKRNTDEKFMLINNTAFDAKGEDIIWHNYGSISKFKAGDNKDSRAVRKNNKSKDKEDIKINNTLFTDALNETLKDMNFIDTTNSIFPSINNSLYLNATIKKITVHYVTPKPKQHHFFQTNNLLSIELNIDWEVLDYYKQKIHSASTNKKSDLFALTYDTESKEFTDVLLKAMEDNLNYALIDIREELSDKKVLSISAAKAENFTSLSIKKPVVSASSKLNDFLKSGVTIKVDQGHGSGVIISEDGYIITAYHVVAGSKKIQVVFNDGSKADAELVRKNSETDVALLKVSNSNLSPLPLEEDPNVEIGIDVWAIGTPKTVELGQSVSKGILSGIRVANNVKHLQTDVSINSGNSGGALVNKQGTVMGIVNSKLMGVGTEGVGFAMSASEILSKLAIQYQ